MGDFPIFRAHSSVVLPRARSVERDGKMGTLTRVTSVPNLDSFRVGDDHFRPSTVFKYRRDYDLMDDYMHDATYFDTPVYWPTYRYAARRYAHTDALTRPWHWQYPAYASRFKWYTDWLNPTYWRRYRDPNYDRPLWNPSRPWIYDRYNRGKAVQMYKQGLIDYKTLDQNWLTPSMYDRSSKDWTDVYTPAGKYGARRYFYNFT